MRVLMTGATGLIGPAVIQALTARGDEVVALGRNPSGAAARDLAALPGVRVLPWRATGVREDWWDEVPRVQAIVNLAGESVAGKRWSAAQKERILQSRLDATHSVVKAIDAATTRPGVLLNASAIGYYGFRGDEPLTESAAKGDDFLASVCYQWESAAREMESPQVRLVLPRIGIVFAQADSALQKMALPFRLFAGGAIGSGRQWVSWIHLDDVVGMLLAALDNPKLSGPVNLTAPNPVRNSELSGILGQTLSRPNWIPVPSLALRAAVGQMSEILVTGQRVLPTAALAAGYTFRHPTCPEAVRSLLQ